MIYTIAYLNLNFGDDLFVRILLRRYPNQEFYICSSDENIIPFKNEKNVCYNRSLQQLLYRLIRKISFRKTTNICNKRKIKQSDCVVYIGGSIFIETQDYERDDSLIESKPLFYIGPNFGPSKTEAYKKYIHTKLRKTVDCCFRDKESYNLFNDINSIRYAPDVAFTFNDLPEYNPGEYIGISIINIENREFLKNYIDNYYNGLTSLCNYYISQGKKVKVFVFCSSEGDLEAAKKLESFLRSDNLQIVVYSGNIDEFISELNTCRTIFATRFHAMIVGWLLGKKVVPIIYSNKQLSVIKDVDYQGYYWDLLHGEIIDLNQVDNDNNFISNKCLDYTKNEAQKQFEKLDLFIKNLK